MDLEPISAAERARRSVFVGNIPYEATEEALKDIFTQAGPVVSFRLVYDRETGKPKGYGFCEYQDVETAQSALRNLNNTDFNGRPLRVGVAAGESNKDDMAGMQQALGGPVLESPYGDSVEPEKAPEAISKAVASLPPEQMFELMKQMKLCIQNNPTEARNMLLQNPQLAYALLQAQIVMKIVDPQVAMAMLHRDSSQVPPPGSSTPSMPAMSQQAPIQATAPMAQAVIQDQGMMGGPVRGPNVMMNPVSAPSGPMSGPVGGMMAGGPMRGVPPVSVGGGYVGPGGMGPDMVGPGPRGPMGGMAGPPRGGDFGRDPRADPRADPRDPRLLGQGDVRGMGGPRPVNPMSSMPQGSMGGMMGGMNPSMMSGGPPGQMMGGPPQDQEKAALIMQVLQLTDQQISMLPPEQRQSILILKEQLAKNVA
ncbi:cleavage stimulation factor subunit 2-like [Dreissena polymorpha]|uniref:cleavage stimulation factor subunit 2-like n=1 Tax=Dreissena polymorpha TaxID=45954 RepID=UPI0022641987|nr:cleavage stimulation factor subunit 2-like [Dreissena polymorpha]